MLKYGNRDFRNLQEQVEANMKNIEDIVRGQPIFTNAELKIVGAVDEAAELPDPETYEGSIGDMYVVGNEAPYAIYAFAKIYENENIPAWVDLGNILVQGPEGPQGPQGEQGIQGEQGPAGQDGLTTQITVNGETYTQVDGNITLPDYPADVAWGNITGTLSSQTDLQNALDNKVTLDTAQTITGAKTFTNNTTIEGDLIAKGGNVFIGDDSNPNNGGLQLYAEDVDGLPGIIFTDNIGNGSLLLRGPFTQPDTHWVLELPATGGTLATTNDIANMVTTDTVQTITGEKTFTQHIKGNNTITSLDATTNKFIGIAHGTSDSTFDGQIAIGDPDTSAIYLQGTAGSNPSYITIPAKSGTIAMTDDIPPIDNKTIIANSQGQIETQIGGYKTDTTGTIINTSMPWGTYGSYTEYLCSVAEGTLTEEQLQADHNAWLNAIDWGNLNDAQSHPCKLCASIDNGSTYTEYDAQCLVISVGSVLRFFIYCSDLGVSGADFRISLTYNQEFLNPGSQLVDSNNNPITNCYISFVGITNRVITPINKNYLPGFLPYISENMPVIAADVDNKTIIHDDNDGWKTRVGGWLEYQKAQTVESPSMPWVQGTYPEYLVSVGNGTITQDELNAQGTIWQTVASNYSVGDAIPIKLCLSEDNSNWDEYDATMQLNNADGLRYTRIICSALNIDTGASGNFVRIQFGTYNQMYANPGSGNKVANPVSGNDYNYCKLKYEYPALNIKHPIDSSYIDSDIARSADVTTAIASATSNMVTTDTAQTISGNKLFNTLSIGANAYNKIDFGASASSLVLYLSPLHANTYIEFRENAGGGIEIIPTRDSAIGDVNYLGNSTHKWNIIYTDTLNNGTNSVSVTDINTAITKANSAVQPADISNMVTTDTAQTISGAKTLSGALVASNNVTLGGSSKTLTIASGTSFVPGANNSIDIGSSSYKFKNLYLAGSLTNGTNSLSIANLQTAYTKANSAIQSVTPTTETWTFTLSNNTTTTKTIVTGVSASN